MYRSVRRKRSRNTIVSSSTRCYEDSKHTPSDRRICCSYTSSRINTNIDSRLPRQLAECCTCSVVVWWSNAKTNAERRVYGQMSTRSSRSLHFRWTRYNTPISHTPGLEKLVSQTRLPVGCHLFIITVNSWHYRISTRSSQCSHFRWIRYHTPCFGETRPSNSSRGCALSIDTINTINSVSYGNMFCTLGPQIIVPSGMTTTTVGHGDSPPVTKKNDSKRHMTTVADVNSTSLRFFSRSSGT